MQKIDKNTSLSKYLRNMAIGEEAIISERVQRYGVIASRVSQLRRKGYAFTVTAKDLVLETKVIKLANPT